MLENAPRLSANTGPAEVAAQKLPRMRNLARYYIRTALGVKNLTSNPRYVLYMQTPENNKNSNAHQGQMLLGIQ